MSFDQFADLAKQQACPQGHPGAASSFASGFVDGCTAWSCRPKPSSPPKGGNQGKKKTPAPADEARRCYMDRATSVGTLALPTELGLDEAKEPPSSAWMGFEVRFTLATPWYSKDDRPFHVLDNPVRKDRVFGVPFVAAASWKGLLRWSSRMLAGLHAHLEKRGGKLDGWSDPDWILQLFGNEKGEDERFQRGALAFYPTWFSKVGFEVINPHSRTRRAGTQPIYYEVVPAGTDGKLRLLYAPLPGDVAGTAVGHLIDAADALLSTYGFSAKRTVGWGTAYVQGWTARHKDQQPITANTAAEFKTKLDSWVNPREAGDE
jgi:CRISPR-associated protein Cmr2